MEFAGELYDFVTKDVLRWFPDLRSHVTVSVVEAGGHLLGTFHTSIVDYVETTFKRRKIDVMTGIAVKEIKDNVALLSNGQELQFGLLVWSTGVK